MVTRKITLCSFCEYPVEGDDIVRIKCSARGVSGPVDWTSRCSSNLAASGGFSQDGIIHLGIGAVLTGFARTCNGTGA